ncbi:MAG: hypothetical protein ALAOOOJD_04371 [bacterium]|nr:hypothetical protein [bacterium]
MSDTNETPGMENQGAQANTNAESAEIAYCVKCRKKNPMVETQRVTMKNGRPAITGKCGVCGTGMYKILSQKS